MLDRNFVAQFVKAQVAAIPRRPGEGDTEFHERISRALGLNGKAIYDLMSPKGKQVLRFTDAAHLIYLRSPESFADFMKIVSA